MTGPIAKKVKKTEGADVVRLMFQLYLKGDGSSGPMCEPACKIDPVAG